MPPLQRTTAVDALAADLRNRILDGELTGRLVERELVDEYDVARHTARAALRALQQEGIVTIVPDKGARVSVLDATAVKNLYELRAALELEAVHLALSKHAGKVTDEAKRAARKLRQTCTKANPRFSEVVEAHEQYHAALVAAAGSPRIEQAHQALATETRLFLVQLQPLWSLERLAEDHDRLLLELEADGPQALRRHLDESAEAVISAQIGAST